VKSVLLIETERDGLMGRIVEISLADLNTGSENKHAKKFKLCVEDVQGKNCFTQFHGFTLSKGKVTYMIRKWTTLVEALVEARTKDGYLLRVFCVGYTYRKQNQVRKTSYAKRTQVLEIRRRMIKIMERHITRATITEFVGKLIAEKIGQEIRDECTWIHPLKAAFIRKVKVLKKPKLDAAKIAEMSKAALKAETEEPRKEPEREEDPGAKNLLAES